MWHVAWRPVEAARYGHEWCFFILYFVTTVVFELFSILKYEIMNGNVHESRLFLSIMIMRTNIVYSFQEKYDFEVNLWHCISSGVCVAFILLIIQCKQNQMWLFAGSVIKNHQSKACCNSNILITPKYLHMYVVFKDNNAFFFQQPSQRPPVIEVVLIGALVGVKGSQASRLLIGQHSSSCRLVLKDKQTWKSSRRGWRQRECSRAEFINVSKHPPCEWMLPGLFRYREMTSLEMPLEPHRWTRGARLITIYFFLPRLTLFFLLSL